MSVKTLRCPSCGAPIKSTEVTKCDYCGTLLVYSSPQKVFRIRGKESVFRGIARNVEKRLEDGYTVLYFRVEQIDSEGNVIDYVQVELREPRIRGTLVDGDEVEVMGKIGKDGILSPKTILNLKTNANITKSGSNVGFIVFLLPFIIGAVGFIGTGATFEGAMLGFLGGCFLAVFIFIIYAVAKR